MPEKIKLSELKVIIREVIEEMHLDGVDIVNNIKKILKDFRPKNSELKKEIDKILNDHTLDDLPSISLLVLKTLNDNLNRIIIFIDRQLQINLNNNKLITDFDRLIFDISKSTRSSDKNNILIQRISRFGR